jgi:hypothetical protein
VEESLKMAAAVLAVIISVASFAVARLADRRSRKAETIRNLLGEMETVAFGALKLLRDGLPKRAQERKLVIAALMQACVISGSDRARALPFRVIETNRPQADREFHDALRVVEETFASMDRYHFEQKELNLERGKRRLTAVRKVLPPVQSKAPIDVGEIRDTPVN